MPVEPFRLAGDVVQVAVPAWPASLPGVDMAGFRGWTADPVELPVVPYPAVTLFLDFGDGLFVDDAGGRTVHGSGIVGLGATGVRGSGRNIDLLQVRLSPVLAYGVLGGAAAGSEAVLALEECWGRDLPKVRERLRAARSWDERFALAAGVVQRRSSAGRAVDPEVAFAWERITRSRGRIRIERLAEETGWSRKRLWARFRAQVGSTPKQAARLVRFDHAAHRLAAGHRAGVVWADGGFVDQSHLHRETMAFTGLTPTALADAPWLAVDPVAWAKPAHTRTQ